MKDLMIDVETMGLHEKSVVAQLAACFFDRKTGDIGEEFLVNIDIGSSLDLGMKVDGHTIYWWLKQKKEIQETLMQPEPLTVTEAAEGFVEFLTEYGPKPASLLKVWCHASFDYPKIVSIFQLLSKAKKTKAKLPFAYTQVKDLRTLTEVAGIDIRNYKRVGAHNALEDCKFQVQYLVDCLNKITIKK